MASRFLCVLLASASLGLLASRPASAAEFTLLIYETPKEFSKRTDAQAGAAYWQAFAAYGEALKAAGVLRGGMPLQSGDAARVVRNAGGKNTVSAKAHAKSAEHLGGFFIIDVANEAAAITWAAKAPAALTGAVEVRPAFPAPPMR